jgi:hypothetical protein
MLKLKDNPDSEALTKIVEACTRTQSLKRCQHCAKDVFDENSNNGFTWDIVQEKSLVDLISAGNPRAWARANLKAAELRWARPRLEFCNAQFRRRRAEGHGFRVELDRNTGIPSVDRMGINDTSHRACEYGAEAAEAKPGLV